MGFPRLGSRAKQTSDLLRDRRMSTYRRDVMRALLLVAIALIALPGVPAGTAAPPFTPAQLSPREPRAGDFLIASRKLADANFAETVVLLLAAGPDGAQGVVVNRRTLVRVATVLPDLEAMVSRPDPLYWGGPVAPESAVLLARLDQPLPNGMPLIDGVWVVRTREGIEQLLAQGIPSASMRLFSGYAGWTSGQLEWELSKGSWFLRRADADRIFADDTDALWKALSLLASAPVA